MKIAIVGGTGKEGRGMALRWARAGHTVTIGSRDAERARETANDLCTAAGKPVHGEGNAEAVRDAELVVLSVPYAAHRETLLALKEALRGKVLVDITVPLKPPDVRRVTLPPGTAAAFEAQALLGSETKVVSALHHVSAVHLLDLEHGIDCDVLACSDDAEALKLALSAISDLGVRALDAGSLANAVALESLTPVLLHLNRKYKSTGVGVRFTGL
jgi:8-hydroxy-5-deazaflavin:NADPH oxidoreductase